MDSQVKQAGGAPKIWLAIALFMILVKLNRTLRSRACQRGGTHFNGNRCSESNTHSPRHGTSNEFYATTYEFNPSAHRHTGRHTLTCTHRLPHSNTLL